MSNRWSWFVVLLFWASMIGCAAHGNPNIIPEGAGFFMGFWHGLILPFSFIASLFTDTVSIYEVKNNGGFYDFGFVWGAGSLLYPKFFRWRVSSRRSKSKIEFEMRPRL